MRRRFGKVMSIVTFRVFLAICVAVAVGITNNFMVNFSNSPDLKLLVSGNLDNIKPVKGTYRVMLTLENRGATVTSSRVKLKVPKAETGFVTVDNIAKQVEVGNTIVVEQGFTKEYENDKETAYLRDIEFKLFPSRNYDVGSLILDFSKAQELNVGYSIVSESMLKRSGYYVFHVVDGKVRIKDGKQWADRASMNATGWGKFFRYVSGKNIR